MNHTILLTALTLVLVCLVPDFLWQCLVCIWVPNNLVGMCQNMGK